MRPLNIAVAGAGLIGKTHIKLIDQHPSCALAAIIDPMEPARALANSLQTPYFGELDEALEQLDLDGMVLATPNNLHVEQGIKCINANIPTLIEKPVAHNQTAGEDLLHAASEANAKILVGHHRMHSPIMESAREIVRSGKLGDLVAVSGSALFLKPDDYFVAGPWRTRLGGGPILINMIHEVGNLRFLCGEIVEVQAIGSNASRKFEVEDSVGILFRFESGAIGTFILSDTAGSARSWEQTSQEDKRYPSYGDEDCYHLSGTYGSLSIPTMRMKRYGDNESRSWWNPFLCETADVSRSDPLVGQLNHFCQLIRGEVESKVTVYDALQNLKVTDAIVEAAKTGERVLIS